MMASKWLEERWELFLPVVAPLGRGQEEQLKYLCEEELEAWKARPSLKQAISILKPLTETRNRIRELFPLTEDNWWINPKSGKKEHLALKYLNFSTEEWLQITLPSEAELQERQEHPSPLAHPFALLQKVEHLLQSTAWPEMVVGLGLATGRGIVELLHTGHFTSKTAFSILFAGPMTIYEVLCDPFEVPTLVDADLVLSSVHRLRQFFGNHFLGMPRNAISQQCRAQVQEAAYKHMVPLVPLNPSERNVYKQLAHAVYPQLAAWAYCPAWADKLLYMATIQKHRMILQATSEKERLTLARASFYFSYVVLDEEGVVDDRRGVRLGEPGVEVVEAFNHTDEDMSTQHPFLDEQQRAKVMNDFVQEEKRASEGEEACEESEPSYVLCDDQDTQQRHSVLGQEEQKAEREEENAALGAEKERTVETSYGSLESQQRVECSPTRNVQREKEPKMTSRQWLEQRWWRLFTELARYTVDDESEEIWASCQVEMAVWRAYCRETKSTSFQKIMSATRVALRTSIPPSWNEWWNPDTQAWEHIGLSYLNCTDDEWEEMRRDWLKHQVLLPDPELIVSRAKGMLYAGLMDAEAWPELVVGIVVLTGQEVLSILKNVRFSRKTSFSLLVQRTVPDTYSFELPTLGRADLVVEAWERARELVLCSHVDEQEQLHQYGLMVRATAAKHFLDLVPLPSGQTDVLQMLIQSVYPCLAMHYYCPSSVESVDYLATICHDRVLLTEPSPGARFAHAAARNYLEYRLADERKGIWLSRPRVEIIEPFQQV